MKDILTSRGWEYKTACRCGGSLREHHEHERHPGFEIRIRPTKNTFTILSRGFQVAGPAYGYSLETKMNELKIW